MAISGPGPVQGGLPVRPTQQPPPTKPTEPAKPSGPVDQVEISSAGRMLDQIQQSGGLRAERLAQIKAAIDAGEYETEEKLDAALRRMLTQLESDADGA